MLLGWHYIGVLQPRLRHEPVPGEPRVRGARRQLPLRHRLRAEVPRGAERRGRRGASEFNDVLGAGLYLRGRTDVDPARIGLWGGSYGGYLTALGLARASNLFAAGVDLHGVHDWNEGIRNFIPDYHPTPERGAARLRVVADGLARRLALAGAADPWRRRPQRLLQPDGEAGRGAAGAEGPRGAARAARTRSTASCATRAGWRRIMRQRTSSTGS